MRILFISRYLPFPGGRENFMFELTKELSKEHEVALITPDGLLSEGFKVYKYKDDYKEIKRIIEDFKPDVINSHTFYLCDHAQKVAKENNIPFAFTIHGNQFVIGDEQRQNLVRKVSEKSDLVITVCEDGNRSIQNNTQAKNIETIYNGVDTVKFAKDELAKERNLLRKVYGLHEESFVFITPSRMIWYKGLDTLVEAINILKEDITNVEFMISIPSSSLSEEEIDYMNDLFLRIENYGLWDNIKVVFAGYQLMPILYRMSDGYILPSLSEQFPLSILEAFSSEIPVISSNVGGVSEAIRNEENGILVEAKNAEDLSKNIKSVFSNRKLRDKLVKNAKEGVDRIYSIEKVSKKYLKTFEQLCNI